MLTAYSIVYSCPTRSMHRVAILQSGSLHTQTKDQSWYLSEELQRAREGCT